MRGAKFFGYWLGMAPDDSPLLLRDTGTQEIYALDWQAKEIPTLGLGDSYQVYSGSRGSRHCDEINPVMSVIDFIIISLTQQ
jgi:hypothetical protein